MIARIVVTQTLWSNLCQAPLGNKRCRGIPKITLASDDLNTPFFRLYILLCARRERCRGSKIREVGRWIPPPPVHSQITIMKVCGNIQLLWGRAKLTDTKIQLQQPIMGCKKSCRVLSSFCEASTFVITSERDCLVGRGKAKWCRIPARGGGQEGGGGVQMTTNFYYTNLLSLLSPINFRRMYDFFGSLISHYPIKYMSREY